MRWATPEEPSAGDVGERESPVAAHASVGDHWYPRAPSGSGSGRPAWDAKEDRSMDIVPHSVHKHAISRILQQQGRTWIPDTHAPNSSV